MTATSSLKDDCKQDINATPDYLITFDMWKASNVQILDNYMLVLEGWKRGLHTEIYKENGTFKISFTDNDNKKISFDRSRNEALTLEEISACSNKELTKQLMLKNNVAVPNGKRYRNVKPSDIDIIIQEMKSIGYPLVLKPTHGTLGIGVIVDIKSAEELKNALQQSIKKNTDLILEEYIQGEDHRLYVVGNQVVAALKRTKAHVIGDGHSTIQELIDKVNLQRLTHPRTAKRPLKIDGEVKRHIANSGYTLESVLAKDEYLKLRAIPSTENGGSREEVTNELPEEVKNLAVRAVKSLPNYHNAAVDVLYDCHSGKAVINEINSRGEMELHMYPMIGMPRNLAVDFFDYYFPNTKENRKDNRLIIDFKEILNALNTQSIVDRVILKPYPEDITEVREVIFESKHPIDVRKQLMNMASKYRIHGKVERNEQHEYICTYVGNEKNVTDFEESIHKSSLLKVLKRGHSNQFVTNGFYFNY